MEIKKSDLVKENLKRNNWFIFNQELKIYLTDFWENDVWDVYECPFYNRELLTNQDKDRLKRFMRFDISNEYIKVEFKYAFWLKISSNEW